MPAADAAELGGIDCNGRNSSHRCISRSHRTPGTRAAARDQRPERRPSAGLCSKAPRTDPVRAIRGRGPAGGSGLGRTGRGHQVSADDWPAESFSSAANITVSGMESDLSGAYWSPPDASLWVVRQNRQVWKMQESGGTFSVVGHWTNLPTGGDLEAITRIDPAEPDTFCVLHEDNGTVYRVDVSGGSPSLVRSWQLTLHGATASDPGAQANG